MMEFSFVPARIVSKRWADELIQKGSIRMNSLSTFGIWENLDNHGGINWKSDCRKDLNEGTVQYFTKGNGPCIFPDDLNAVINSAEAIDDTDIKFFRIFCLYCLRYSNETHDFEKPSQRLKELGDTAVVITDFNDFAHRFWSEISRRYPVPICTLMDEVFYFSANETQTTLPMYSKIDSYSWQNEFRFAFAERDGSRPLDNGKWTFVKDTRPVFLEIGNLSDIAFAVPIGDFIKLNFDTSKISMPQQFDDANSKMLQDTRKQMAEHQATSQRFTFSI